MFTPNSPHISLSLAGVDIFTNGSASHHEFQKLGQRIDLIRQATAKCGGLYLYANQQGCDGERVYYDGCAMIVLNGQLLAQGSQFSLDDVQVLTATVDLDQVRAYRAGIVSRNMQASFETPFPNLEISMTGSEMNALTLPMNATSFDLKSLVKHEKQMNAEESLNKNQPIQASIHQPTTKESIHTINESIHQPTTKEAIHQPIQAAIHQPIQAAIRQPIQESFHTINDSIHQPIQESIHTINESIHQPKNLKQSQVIQPSLYSPSQDIKYGPACWLWDYLRRSKAGGFFLPLSGGVDSCATALIVFSMCEMVFQKRHDALVMADLKRIVNDADFNPTSPQSICKYVN